VDKVRAMVGRVGEGVGEMKTLMWSSHSSRQEQTPSRERAGRWASMDPEP
jgi:hypothetical protein